MTRRIARAARLSLAAAASLTTALSPALAQMTAVGPGEGELSIVAWAGYVERGETDPAYDLSLIHI
jgi:putative spermidine/putrescine transport system substrate-binding protein